MGEDSLSMIFLTPGVGATVVGCYNIVMVLLQIPLISKIQNRRSGVIGVYGSLTRLIWRFTRNHLQDPSGYRTLVNLLGAEDMVAFPKRWETWVISLKF